MNFTFRGISRKKNQLILNPIGGGRGGQIKRWVTKGFENDILKISGFQLCSKNFRITILIIVLLVGSSFGGEGRYKNTYTLLYVLKMLT